jgi:HUS1 checkpoint protein
MTFEAQDNIFSDYRIESNSNNNTIALEFSITPLVQALRSAGSKGGDNRDAAEVTLKLVKRGGEAALGLDVKTQTRDGKKVNVVHEVHVLVRFLSRLVSVELILVKGP